MEEKINIAELLKDCPKGMELYSPIFGIVYFQEVRNTGRAELIIVTTSCNSTYEFYNDGKFNTHYSDSEMLLFPSKDQRDWSKFQRPFKDEDIIYVKSVSNIEPNPYSGVSFKYNGHIWGMCARDNGVEILIDGEIKERVFLDNKPQGKSAIETMQEEKVDNTNKIEPKFKVGNKIEKCGYRFTIAEVKDDYYLTKCGNKIPIDNQDDFSLVLNKFDITTLKAFDKVLVRDENRQEWVISLFSHCNRMETFKYSCVNRSGYAQCIPYEGNQELLGTTKDCDEYYKNWI